MAISVPSETFTFESDMWRILLCYSTVVLPPAKSAWAVLVLFLIPIGGGIPAGVLLAKARGLSWVWMEILYLISDIILAFVFEPLMLGVIAMGRKVHAFRRFADAMKRVMQRTTAPYGTAGGPLALILIAFGVDPMTGRAAAAAAGHGFVSGWTLAITGDMMYFTVIMISTLWLNSIFGNATLTMTVILIAMVAVPEIIQRRRRAAAEKG
jgi:hypothetical protein